MTTRKARIARLFISASAIILSFGLLSVTSAGAATSTPRAPNSVQVAFTPGQTTATISWTPAQLGDAATSYTVVGATNWTCPSGGTTSSDHRVVCYISEGAYTNATACQAASDHWLEPAGNSSYACFYTYDAQPQGVEVTCTTSTTSCTLPGLVVGDTYKLGVNASNSVGTSLYNSYSGTLIITAAPGVVGGLKVSYAPGQTSLGVTWTTPTTGYPAPSGYTVTLTPTTTGVAERETTTATSFAFSTYNGQPLVVGTSYVVGVTATNSVGTGPVTTSAPVVITALPGAPTNVVAAYVAGKSGVTVTWTAPTTGYPAPSGYTVTPSPASAGCTSTVTNCKFSALTPGVTYTFTVTATNAVGTGGSSAPSNALLIKAVPTAPGTPTFSYSTGRSVTLSWSPPANDGNGSPSGVSITSYKVTSTPGGLHCTSTGAPAPTSCAITGLVGSTSYTFSVTATNGVGTGPASGASATLTTPRATKAPGAPTFTNPVANVTAVRISWRAPVGCASGCTYDVYVNGDRFTSTAKTSLTVTGLVPDRPYRFQVSAVSAAGASAKSSKSRAVVAWAAVFGSGAVMPVGHHLYSASKAYVLSLTASGTLVLRHGTRTLWSVGRDATALKVLANGNVVLVRGSVAQWQTGTHFSGQVLLRISNGGALQVFNGTHLVWQRGGLPVAPPPPVTTTTSGGPLP